MGALMSSETEKEARAPLDAGKLKAVKPRERDYKPADTGGLYFVSVIQALNSWYFHTRGRTVAE